MTTREQVLQLTPFPALDVVAAHWQLYCAPQKAMLGPQPIVTRPMLEKFLEKAAVPGPAGKLTEVLKTLDLHRALAIAAREFERYDAIPAAEEEAIAWLEALVDDGALRERARAALQDLMVELDIDLDPIRRMHEESRYDQSPTLVDVMGADLDVRIIPSITLLPAPNGKSGFYRTIDGRNRLTLVFGFANHVDLDRPGYIDWPQWWRLGIWHFMGRLYWTRRLDALALSDEEQAQLFSRIPAEFLSKVGIHESTVTRNKTWRAYFLDQFIGATKAIGELEVAGPVSAAGQEKWFSSLGRFHVHWFLERLSGRRFDEIDMAGLVADWARDLPGLTAGSPAFSGPLGACENPLWNDNRRDRLSFSPSVGKTTRRILRMWFASFWPVTPTLAEDADAPDLAATDTVDLVFGLWRDRDWIAGLRAEVAADILPTVTRKDLAADLAGAEPAASLVYARRAARSPECWHRICLAPDDAALEAVHGRAHHYNDWTAIIGDTRENGIIRYPD
ncbi:MAG: hypothetical protein R3D02_10575 [Hyphomicrobiales bacterium]